MSVVKLVPTITLSLSVSDRKASAQWYEDMLGFKVAYHADEIGWSEMTTATEGVTLGLGEQMEVKPGNCVPVFGVTDLADARAGLEAKGVRFDGATETIDGMVSLATLYDPDGNALMLAQDLTEQG